MDEEKKNSDLNTQTGEPPEAVNTGEKKKADASGKRDSAEDLADENKEKQAPAEEAAMQKTDPEETERAKLRFMQGPARLITYGIIVGVVLLFCILFVAISGHWKYSGYRVVSSRRQEDTLAASYCNVNGDILRYGTDGASLSDRTGTVLWDTNFSMTNPSVAVCGNTVAVYDRSGSDIVVCNRTGRIGTVSSHLPVVKAKVSPAGNVATIEEDTDNSYIEYYAPDGSKIAEIRTSMDNPGYPMDVAISEDGQLLAVAYLNVSNQIQRALVRIYSFGAAGQNQMDYRIGDFEYTDRLIPEVENLGGSSFVAFADNGFHVFSGSSQPSEEASVTEEGKISSVFQDETHIGLVTNESDGDHLKIYNTSGRELLDKTFDFSYQTLDFTGNEVSFYNGSRMYVIGTNGAVRFDGAYNGALQQIFALGRHRYVVVRESALDMIQLQ